MIAPEPFLEPRGTPFSVYNRIKALLTLGYKVDLVTYAIGNEVALPGLRIYRSPALPFIRQVKIGPSLAKLPLDGLVFLTALWRLCVRRYRYIHTHEEAGVMGAMLSSVFRCKHLYDMHSDLAQQMANFSVTRNPLLIWGMGEIEKRIIDSADTVIAICADLKDAVARYTPGKPVYLIENIAVDESLPPADQQHLTHLREKLHLGNDPVLLYTGTLELYQGIDLLLHSIVQVHRVVTNAHYVIVGGRPEQVEKYQQLAQHLEIVDSVHFTGQQPLEEMPAYMALADILLSPRSEGTNTPLKLYTYLKSGKPILATKIYSHTQILTANTSMLVEPSADGLARGAIALLQNRELAKTLGENGKQLAAEHYSWQAFLEKNRCAYEDFTRPEFQSPKILLLRRPAEA